MSANLDMHARHAPWTPRVRQAAERERLATTSVVVLHGGVSSEREISLVSGRGILAALAADPPGEARFERVQGVEIDARGDWIVGGRAHEPAAALALLPRDALYFLGLHGGAGEDGRIQAFLEIGGRPYTGSGPSASTLCMDKHLSRLAFAAAGNAVAAGRTFPHPSSHAGEGAGPVVPPGPGPWFAKPVHGGSSVGTRRVERAEDLPVAVASIHADGDDALVECAVDGIEVTVGIVGNRASGIRALPLVEILPRRSPFFDYREKYAAEGGAIELCPAQHLSAEQEERVAARARVAYRAAGCDGYARVDFVLPRNAEGSFAEEPVVLEANTLPGFTPTSLVPREAAALGVSFRELCLEICVLALERHDRGIR